MNDDGADTLSPPPSKFLDPPTVIIDVHPLFILNVKTLK